MSILLKKKKKSTQEQYNGTLIQMFCNRTHSHKVVWCLIGILLPGRNPELSLIDTGLFSVENADFSEDEEGSEELSRLFYPCVWWVRAKLFGGNSTAFLVRYLFLKC